MKKPPWCSAAANFLSGPTIFKFQASGIDQDGIIWTDFISSGLSLASSRFFADWIWFSLQDWIWFSLQDWIWFSRIGGSGSSGFGSKRVFSGLDLGSSG